MRSRKCFSLSVIRATIFIDRLPLKHKLGREHWVLPPWLTSSKSILLFLIQNYDKPTLDGSGELKDPFMWKSRPKVLIMQVETSNGRKRNSRKIKCRPTIGHQRPKMLETVGWPGHLSCRWMCLYCAWLQSWSVFYLPYIYKQDMVPCKHTAASGKGLHLPGSIAPSDTGKQQVNYKGADSAARSAGKPQASAECRWEGPYCHSSHSHSGGSIKVANNYFNRQEKHQKSFCIVFRVKTYKGKKLELIFSIH